MKINAKFDQRVVVHSEALAWQDSPMPGVSRRPLDRVGDEVARATTIVRYDPNSHFSPHVHTGGEEFVVLSGVFQDEHGDFPAGSYIRNPPQSQHTPGSKEGCIIFVKLWQFQPEDRTHVRLNTQFMAAISSAEHTGIAITPLYKDQFEDVSLLHFQAGASVEANMHEGAELLVLEGKINEQEDRLEQHSWLRIPSGGTLKAKAGTQGAKVWIKQGHLSQVNAEVSRVTAS